MGCHAWVNALSAAKKRINARAFFVIAFKSELKFRIAVRAESTRNVLSEF